MEDPVVLEEQAGTSSRLHPLERPKFGELLAYARPGDTVHISEMFRLVRGTGHILDVLDVLHRDQVALRIHDGAFSAMDPSSSSAASPSTAPRAPQRSQLSARRTASTRTASPPSRATPCSESSGLQDHPVAGFRRIWVMPRRDPDPRARPAPPLPVPPLGVRHGDRFRGAHLARSGGIRLLPAPADGRSSGSGAARHASV
ncbi:recombinase family protein [Kitasatospora sp. NPDC087315]|uniref:recombinase family protein n=1 Tax=Kitasatospora sp. NPDC087315 TaxID=3364069 RepID=UPI00381BE0F5